MIVKHDLTKDGSIVIYQDSEKNCYTFDSILLSWFTTVNKGTKNVVDLCSGNAPIAMLIAHKKQNDDIKVIGVEIQAEISKLAQESIVANNLESKVEIVTDSLVGISAKLGQNFFDLVTCNPPYFRVDNTSNINPNNSIALARHEIAVNLDQVISESRKLLDNNGVLSFVHRPERLDEIIISLNKHGFVVKRLQLVYPRVGSMANTVLIEAKKGQNKHQMKIEEPIFVYDSGNDYTEQAKEIINSL